MPALQILMAGVFLAACATAAAQDCSNIAGDWTGTWSETDCDGVEFSGTWSAEITSSCILTSEDVFGDGSIDPATGNLTVPPQNTDCGTLTVMGTFQNDMADGTWSYSWGGIGEFEGNRVLVDTDGDGDPDVTDPDDDNDGIGDALDDQPLVWSNLCTSSDGDNATLGETVVAEVTCAANVSIGVVPPTTVLASGELCLISPTVTFHSGVEVAGGLTVTNTHPCPGCSP